MSYYEQLSSQRCDWLLPLWNCSVLATGSLKTEFRKKRTSWVLYPLYAKLFTNFPDVVKWKGAILYIIAVMDRKESVLVYYEAEFHSGSLHQGNTSQGLDKASAVCCLFAMSSASFCKTCVAEDMWQRERPRAREKTELKEDKGHLSSAASPPLLPSEYFVNKLNPVLYYILLDVMWICFQSLCEEAEINYQRKLKYQKNRMFVLVWRSNIHTSTVGCLLTNAVCSAFV